METAGEGSPHVPGHALLRINDVLSIPRAELDYRATRSGGPGGQHVNTSSTRVELWWDVAGSPSLDGPTRERLLQRLAGRIDSRGMLRLASSRNRSQHRNREDVTERLARIVAEALEERKPRRRTKVPRAAKEARLRSKRRRSETKRNRGPVGRDD